MASAHTQTEGVSETTPLASPLILTHIIRHCWPSADIIGFNCHLGCEKHLGDWLGAPPGVSWEISSAGNIGLNGIRRATTPPFSILATLPPYHGRQTTGTRSQNKAFCLCFSQVPVEATAVW